MRRSIFPAVTLMCVSILLSAAYCAEVEPAVKTPAGQERKQPGSAFRPDKKAPSEQLVHANALRDAGKRAKAAAQYRALVHKWHDSPEAAPAQLEYARLLEARGDYEGAFDEYEYLVGNFTGGFSYGEVLDSQFRIANLLMTTKSRFLWLFGTSDNLETALAMFEKIVLNGPRWSRAAEAQFNVGWIRERLGAYQEAIVAYETTQQAYPGTSFMSDAAFRQGHCLYVLAMDNSREERGFQVARTHLRRFIRNYPDHESAGEAAMCLDEITERLSVMAYERARFYDKQGGRHSAALIAYTDFLAKFPSSSRAEAAQERVGELRAALDDLPVAGSAEGGQGRVKTGNDDAAGENE